MVTIYVITAWLACITAICVGILAYVKNPHAETNKRWTFLNIAIGIWGLFLGFMFNSKDSRSGLFYSQLLMVGANLIPVTFYHFVLAFLGQEKNKQQRRILICGYLSTLFLLLINFTPLFVKSATYKTTVKCFYPDAGPLFILYIIVFFWLSGYSYLLMRKAATVLVGLKRNQVKYVILGSIIGFLGGATTFPLWYQIKFPPLGSHLVWLYAVIITIAIMRYRLMDINIVLTRAGIFLIVYFFVLGAPFLLGYKYGLWQLSTWITLLLATAGPFIFQYLRSRAEDVILHEQRIYQRALRELSATMTRIHDLNQLLKTINHTVADTVKSNFCAFYLKDEAYGVYAFKSCYPEVRSHFQDSIAVDSDLVTLLKNQRRPIYGDEIGEQKEIQLDSGVLIPLFMDDELFGFMLLGPKPKNQIYTSDDLLVFETLSYSTSLAIENCIYWKEIEDRQRKARLQEMDTYSYSLAHEIDNPMQVILGHAGFLKKEVLENVASEEKRKEIIGSFDFILEAARRVSGMVKAIRDFGQKTTGELKPLNIEDVVDSFEKLYYPKFKEKTVFFEKTSNLQNAVFVRGEKPELMQVLFILADNSIHAMTGLKEKRVSLKIEAANHDRVRIIFSDNGYGIKKEILEIIFAPFTTTKASSEGTGMGLYNAKNMVQRHKGRIWAESKGEGRGATFIIELPVANDVKPEDFKKENKEKRLF